MRKNSEPTGGDRRPSSALDRYLDEYREVRPIRRRDVAAVAAIYNHYILETIVTFEEEAVSDKEMAKRVAEVQKQYPFLVAVNGTGEVVGYAYATKWSARCAYRNSVETTVYLRDGEQGQGTGTRLLRALLDALRAQDMHTAIAGIALPNAASVALHEKMGFAKVAEFVQVGHKFGQWINVGYWQLLLKGEKGA